MAGIGGQLQDIFPLIELLDQSIETGAGENDEAAAILALVSAQNYFETLCASLPNVLQDTIVVSTVPGGESTVWPTQLLRLDGIWMLDVNGNPIQKLQSIREVGGHVANLPWPVDILSIGQMPGTPFAFYANMKDFYWLPRPDGTRSIRLYGFLEKPRVLSRTADFNYPYRCHLAFAQFAVKLMQIGADDANADIDRLAGQVFGPLLKQLRKFDRTAPMARHYTEFHTT